MAQDEAGRRKIQLRVIANIRDKIDQKHDTQMPPLTGYSYFCYKLYYNDIFIDILQ